MATVPGKPAKLTASSITSNSVRLRGSDPGNGGSSIVGRRVFGARFGSTTPATVHAFDLDYTWTGLLSGFPYEFWWQVWNAVGDSPVSDRVRINTLRVPDAPVAPSLSDIRQTTFRASYPDPFDGGTGIFNRFIGISSSSTANPTAMLPYHGALFDLYGSTSELGSPLLPGRTYYVRGRVRNSVGDSNWGPATRLDLIAGAFVKVSGIWKPAVPYVRDAGVWKLVRPQGRILGIWEETG